MFASQRPKDPSVSQDYMQDVIQDVTPGNIQLWIANAASLPSRRYDGYEIKDGIDGKLNPKREVSLAFLYGPCELPQHRHNKSDALLIVVSGQGYFLSGTTKYAISEGDRIAIPRGLPHGFTLESDMALSFVSVQSPPIRNRVTGVEDFHVD